MNLAEAAHRLLVLQGSNTSDVSGEVVRWSHDNGVAKLDASQYIEMLEREVEILRQELDDSNEVWSHREHAHMCVLSHFLTSRIRQRLHASQFSQFHWRHPPHVGNVFASVQSLSLPS